MRVAPPAVAVAVAAMNPAAEETHLVLGLTLAIEGQLDEAERVRHQRRG